MAKINFNDTIEYLTQDEFKLINGEMMNFKDRISEDLKSSMKNGDKLRTETIRMLRAQILDFEKKGLNRELNEDDAMSILTTAVKRRRESIEQYEKGGRLDLADAEIKEIAIISEYLPKQLSREDAESIISKIITNSGAVGPKDMGKVMPAVMKELKGKVDGKIINEIVKQKLS